VIWHVGKDGYGRGEQHVCAVVYQNSITIENGGQRGKICLVGVDVDVARFRRSAVLCCVLLLR
jgi:hypothetical protein